jgi:predicted NUDIX family phosphoesterase
MEFVWVVPRSALFSKAAVHGLAPLQREEFENRFSTISREHGFFVERRRAEVTPEWKQPIPYVAVCCEDKVFTMTRLTGGEARLHGKRSIGVGGHINPCDGEGQGVDGLLAAACRRELDEELVFPADAQQLEPLGLLNDDTTEVGAVHIGVVYRLVLTPAQAQGIRIRETESLAGEFLPYTELLRLAEQDEAPFESWSTLLLRSGVLAQEQSAPSMSLA